MPGIVVCHLRLWCKGQDRQSYLINGRGWGRWTILNKILRNNISGICAVRPRVIDHVRMPDCPRHGVWWPFKSYWRKIWPCTFCRIWAMFHEESVIKLVPRSLYFWQCRFQCYIKICVSHNTCEYTSSSSSSSSLSAFSFLCFFFFVFLVLSFFFFFFT